MGLLSNVCAGISIAFVATTIGTDIAGGDDTRAVTLGLPSVERPFGDSSARIELGRLLFSAKALSSDATISCATCHVPSLAFSGPEAVAVGVGGARGNRHPPPLLNLVLEKRFMLDGRASSLEEQIHIPLESPTEMNVAWPVTLARLNADPVISAAVGRASVTPLTRDFVLKSLAAYVRSLISGGSPFDRYYYLGDEAAISAEAKYGLELFVRKGRCSGCHLVTGYAAPFTDGSFHSIGIGFANGAYRDLGRFAITGLKQDQGAFKTPTLRDVAQRHYFMHDGSMASLREVLDYYNKGGNAGAPNIDGRVHPLFLSDEDESDIIEFLRTLSAPIGDPQQLQ
jgi:cytochrome c peroxidase